jgi:hypothetical protein
MVSLRWKITALVTFTFLFAAASWAQIGPGPFAVFPSASTTDARFLGFGCPGTATFEQNVVMGLAVPANQSSLTVSLFDGDTGKPDAAGRRHWDLGTRQIVFSVYADPLRQLTTSPGNLIGSWKGNDPNPLSGPTWTVSSATMPDNDWWGVTISSNPAARAPSGNYFYTLVIGLDGACAAGESLESNLKIAASNPMAFLVPRFGIVAAMRQFLNDGPIVYPGPVFPPPGNDFLNAPTTYDGTFEFFLSLPPGERDLRLYDGDFDHGTNSLTGQPLGTLLTPCSDTDDPDTPADYSGFPFSTVGVNPEQVRSPGSPADDNSLDAFRRGELGSPGRIGCVRYEVTDPLGTVYRNDNPSGSFEWEQFRITTPLAVDPSNSDYVTATDTLPSGVWKVKVIGLDLSNLNFFFADTCSTRVVNGQNQAACPAVSAYLLGNTVWLDSNGNGVQDPGEPGIPGVTLKVSQVSDAMEIGSATTADTASANWIACQLNNTGLDEAGLYCFGVNTPGSYFVEVAAENFQPGGPLYGYASTTGNQHTDTLVDGNVLTYNFGYRPNGSIGDRLWLDANGDGVQDSGEPGLSGVTVELLDPNGGVIATTATAGNGLYVFGNLAGGVYTVRVVAASLPAGLTAIHDLDGTATAHAATLTLGAGETRGDVDFGYRGTASLGDRLWLDADGDGVQDSSEPGLSGVTVELVDANGSVTATDVTEAGGLYSFDSLSAGVYTVRVVAASLQAGLAATFDLDGTGTAHTATLPLAGGETRGDVDFGYRGTSSLGDRLWADANANGVQDAGEAGINGVTLELRDGDGNVVATAVTSGDGKYVFDHLPFGTYTVAVAASTLPVGVVPSFDRDGIASANTATVSVPPASSITDVDFGYRGTTSLGDRVWSDLNANGAQDSGETGINGVTVLLYSATGSLIATTVTAGDGTYSFSSLFAGTYSVRVDTGTLPAGFGPTYDLDGTGTANAAAATLAAGASRSDVDFGYYRASSNPGTGTIGYWKTHPEAWPVPQITIGGVSYTRSQAISVMDGPSRGDKTIDLFKQLVAAKLNVIIDNDATCIAASIVTADAWLATYPVGSNVKSSSLAWMVAGPLHQKLDDYNNGQLCAPHRN